MKFYYFYIHQQSIMPKPTIECSNCNQCFEAHYPYCPYCGQQAEDKLTLGVLFTNTISNYFSIDARFFRSFIPLMTKPGYLAKKFVQGKRLLYIHPAQMYLFISVVFFFLFSFISREQTQHIDSDIKKGIERSKTVLDSVQQRYADSLAVERFLKPLKTNQEQLGFKDKDIKAMDSIIKTSSPSKNSIMGIVFKGSEIDSMINIGAADKEIYTHMGMEESDSFFEKRMYTQILKFYKNKSGGSILQAFYDSIPIAMFMLLPIFALILKIFYFRKGQFAHHLVFTFYFFSFLFTVFSILTLASLLWDGFPLWIITLVMLSTFFYLFLGVKHYYQQGYLLSFIKSNVITFMFLSIVLPFTVVIMSLVAFLFY